MEKKKLLMNLRAFLGVPQQRLFIECFLCGDNVLGTGNREQISEHTCP